MIAFLVKLFGGYTDAESAIGAIHSEEEKKRILTLAVEDLFNTIGPDDILQIDGDTVSFMGKQMPQGSMKLLRAEATQLLATKLWKVLKADIQYHANKRMFTTSQTEADLVAGKLWLYTLDAIETRLKSLGAPHR